MRAIGEALESEAEWRCGDVRALPEVWGRPQAGARSEQRQRQTWARVARETVRGPRRCESVGTERDELGRACTVPSQPETAGRGGGSGGSPVGPSTAPVCWGWRAGSCGGCPGRGGKG